MADRKAYGSHKKVRKKAKPHLDVKKTQKKTAFPSSRTFSSKGKVFLPSIIHPKDQSEMVLVSAGEYLVGSLNLKGAELNPKNNPGHLKTFPAFYVDRNEITVEQYKKFDRFYNEKPYTESRECLSCPAMGIDWEHAKRYCVWSGKRLPGEEEWEAAARGFSSGPWPWGNEFSPQRANLRGNDDGYVRVAPVGSFPRGASSHGALDMIGNVWEWVDAPPGEGNGYMNRRVVKGGGWSSALETATISNRNLVDPKLQNPAFGFRCMKPSNGAETDFPLPNS